MHWKAWESALPCCGWSKRFTICFCQKELYLVLHEICAQRTLMNSILLILCFCFELHCSSFQYLFCKCTTFVLHCVVIRPKCPKQLSLPYNSYWKSLQTVMFVNASNYVPEDVFKVRPLLVESLVIVIFYVIFLSAMW